MKKAFYIIIFIAAIASCTQPTQTNNTNKEKAPQVNAEQSQNHFSEAVQDAGEVPTLDTLSGIALIADWSDFQPSGKGSIKMMYRRGAAVIQRTESGIRTLAFYLTDGSEWVQVSKSSILEFYAMPGNGGR